MLPVAAGTRVRAELVLFFEFVYFYSAFPRPCARPATARSAVRGPVAASGSEASAVGAVGCGDWAV